MGVFFHVFSVVTIFIYPVFGICKNTEMFIVLFKEPSYDVATKIQLMTLFEKV